MTFTQKALIFRKPPGEYCSEIIEVPTPGDGQILIKVQAAALSPSDWKIKKYYDLIVKEYPVMLGCDISGDVQAIGHNAANFEIGDRVFCATEIQRGNRAFQQYFIVDAKTTSKIPDNMTYDEASTLPVGLLTAYSGLYAEFPYGMGIIPPVTDESRTKYLNLPFLVLGGASSVGQCVIQLAKMSGFSPIITTASHENTEALMRFGATHVLGRDLAPEVLIEAISSITTRPFKFVYDAVSSKDTQELVIRLLPAGGRAAFVLPLQVESAREDAGLVEVYASTSRPFNVELFRNLYHQTLYDWMAKGLVSPNRFEVLPDGLNGVVHGLNRMEHGNVSRLKLIIHPQDTT